jgi:hypothetical protein
MRGGGSTPRALRAAEWPGPCGWVDEDGDPDVVVGSDSLTGHRLVPDDLPRRIGPGSPAESPAVLLARLARDLRHPGGGHGGVPLVDALTRTVIATQTVAARSVVADA